MLLTRVLVTVAANIYRRLGGESDREILMGPACVILSLGSGLRLVVRRCRVPLGLVFDFVAKWIKKWFCEIVDDPWWFLHEFW